MEKKYFDTKKGSVEEKINTIASEQPTINATYTPDVKLSTEKKYFETKPGSLADAASKIVSEALDPVNKDAVKKKFDDRKDKDIDNDGDTDSTDKYLHKRRAAISKATSEELGKEDEPKVQKIIGKLKKASDAHAGQAKDLEKAMKEEITDSERMAKMRVSQMKLQTKLRDLDVGNPNDKTKIAITKNDLENIQMKMDQLKNKREQKEHPAKALYEKIAGLQKKAEKTGMPYSILKQVYNRGMAAWKGGHRPGTTPQQWAMARVNSFVTKSSGTWGGADKDLAKKVRSSK